jgi:hypothetical protein
MDESRERLEARRPAGRLPRSSRQEVMRSPFPVSQQQGWSKGDGCRRHCETGFYIWMGWGAGKREEATMIQSFEPGEVMSETENRWGAGLGEKLKEQEDFILETPPCQVVSHR